MTNNINPIDDDEHRKLAVEAWKKVVQTQEHFNEICMKVRTLYATVLAAIISVYGVVIKQSPQVVQGGNVSVDAIVPVALAVTLSTALFYFVDRYWYHQLLLGSVDQGIEIEGRWANIIPEIALGSKISARSQIDMAQRPIKRRLAQVFVSDPRLKTDKKIHSDAKIELFYKPPLYVAGIIFITSLLCGGVKINSLGIGERLINFAQACIT